jgi:hypothetical protein
MSSCASLSLRFDGVGVARPVELPEEAEVVDLMGDFAELPEEDSGDWM